MIDLKCYRKLIHRLCIPLLSRERGRWLLILLFFFSSGLFAQQPTLYLIGDSTMADKKDPERNPEHGWGQVLPEYFEDEINIENYAANGRSSKSFIGEGRWKTVHDQLKKGDFVFIQFGHNDQKFKSPDRYTNPFTTYRANLEKYVRESREKGANPILFTSIVRRNFNEDNVLIDTHGDYPLVVRLVANDMHVPFVDLQRLTELLVLGYGEEKSKDLYLHIAAGENDYASEGKVDNTHLSKKGAHEVAALALREIEKQQLELSNYLKPSFSGIQIFEDYKQVLRQSDEWYKSKEARRIAENVMLYQKANGGWEKNINMAKQLTVEEKKNIFNDKSNTTRTTIDNRATVNEIRFLVKMFDAEPNSDYQAHLEKGIQYLLDAQYKNGGWPQYYPIREGYYSRITFNDDAMIGVMNLLKDVSQKKEYRFICPFIKKDAEKANKQGLKLILKTQITVDGEPTIWCAQYDENTLQPAKARAFELPSLSGAESVGIVYYLMSIEEPSTKVKKSIRNAVKWFENHKIEGKKVIWENYGTEEADRKIIDSPEDFEPLWGRFNDIATGTPIFVGRDGVIHSNLADIEQERRAGYNYIDNYAQRLLEKDFPNWAEKHLSSLKIKD